MTAKFENFLSDYMRSRVGVFKKYLLAALDSKDGCLWYLESREGTVVPSADLKNCELLRDAELFTEDTKIDSRHGRNSYKFFCLTELGKQYAEELKQESSVDIEIPSAKP
jgi:hypothetical protein